MKCRLVFVSVTMLLLTSIAVFAQRGTLGSSADVAFWVDYWGKPRVALYGPEEQAFNQNVHEIMFPVNVFDRPLDPNTLNENVQWLKDHPNARFYIDGYASSDGQEGYNLNLSRQRAEWVRRALIRKGIAENRIALAVPWGQLYPTCAERDHECWSKNRVVRFVYSAN
ncbi:OmpA family protein [Tunturiibacter gelidoferens]|uniref:Outer membrane protein OmpA-like peptidoglycan-associated protein n=1 Tax=Tunturiibacter lichenicola TaxID=2051959 RepID=A0A7Y9NMG9_9BACT|nr:OmpA family protein [Edaphobacter lichenicola]NYF51982.1 outer membrane protein OmpA-like peptidoglycan-associated protein [Edaphobacter lichenicola]